MSNVIEKDAKKKQKRLKIAKICAIIAAVFVAAWVVYSVAVNPNVNERRVINAMIHVYKETKEPASNQLIDCSKLYDGRTSKDKKFKYVIADIKQGTAQENYLLVVSGEGEGKIYSAETLYRLDFPEKDSVRLEITEHQEDLNLQLVQKTLLHYWKFYDVV